MTVTVAVAMPAPAAARPSSAAQRRRRQRELRALQRRRRRLANGVKRLDDARLFDLHRADLHPRCAQYRRHLVQKVLLVDVFLYLHAHGPHDQ